MEILVERVRDSASWSISSRILAAAVVLVVGSALTIIEPSLDVGGIAALTISLLFAAVLGALLYRGRTRDLMSPSVFFPIVLLAYYGFGSLPLTSWGGVRTGLLLVVLLAAASFLVGTSFVGVRPGAPTCRMDVTFDPSRVVVAAIGVSALAVAAFVVMFVSSGIPILSSVEGSRLVSAANGPLNTLALSIRGVLVALVALLFARHLRGIAQVAIVATMLALGIGLLIATGNRGHLVLVFVCSVALFHYLVRPLSYQSIALVGLIGLLLYSLAGYYRATQSDSTWARGIEAYYGIPAQLAPLAPAYLSVRSVPVYLQRIIDVVPDEHAYTLGLVSLSPVATLLPGHQSGIDEYLKNDILHMQFVGFGIAAGLLSPAYVDAGYFGIVVTLMLAGAAAQFAYRLAQSGDLRWIALYAYIAGDLVIALYGSLVNSFSVLWLPVVITGLLAIGKRYVRSPTSRDAAPDARATVPARATVLLMAVGLVALGIGATLDVVH